MHLIDYKVRVVNAHEGTAARVRVLIESGTSSPLGTVGVSENVIEASWLAWSTAWSTSSRRAS
jgi:2-isopropylmalate synthase